jgi:TRAP-type mannitol/chloroaromatic compound transport system permease large subunit
MVETIMTPSCAPSAGFGIEIGLLKLWLGLSVFVIKSSVDDESITLGAIFVGAFLFVLIALAVTILLMVFPQLSLLLL